MAQWSRAHTPPEDPFSVPTIHLSDSPPAATLASQGPCAHMHIPTQTQDFKNIKKKTLLKGTKKSSRVLNSPKFQRRDIKPNFFSLTWQKLKHLKFCNQWSQSTWLQPGVLTLQFLLTKAGHTYLIKRRWRRRKSPQALNNTGLNFRILFFAFRRQLGSQDLPRQDLTVPVSCTSQTSSNLRC